MEKSDGMVKNLEELTNTLNQQRMLITAGTPDQYNMMTASRGGFGVLWGKKVAFIFVRKNRYTNEFIQKSDQISLSFFDEKYRDILTLCGTKSGREIDKMKEVPLTMQENFTFQEAKVTIQGEKIFETELDPSLIKNPEIKNQRYQGQENHMMYILEIKEIRQ